MATALLPSLPHRPRPVPEAPWVGGAGVGLADGVHLAVRASGVWVVRAERGSGRVRVGRGPAGDRRVWMGDEDRTALVRELQEQVTPVREAVGTLLPGTPVRGVLCVDGAALPLLRRLALDGVLLVHPRQLARRLGASGPIAAAEARALVAVLGRRAPAVAVPRPVAG